MTVCNSRGRGEGGRGKGLGLGSGILLREQRQVSRCLTKTHTLLPLSLVSAHSHPDRQPRRQDMAEVKLDAKVFHRRAKGLLSFWKVHPFLPVLAPLQSSRAKNKNRETFSIYHDRFPMNSADVAI